MPYTKYPLLSKNNLKTQSIKTRKSLVRVQDFADPIVPGADFGAFLKSLPDFLSGRDLKEFVRRMTEARKKDKPIVWGMGGHIIKVGLARVLIDIMERGWVSALAVNGAFLIHDFEIALAGVTSEDVAENLHRGSYGNTQETGLFLNLALKEGMRLEVGAGEAVGQYLLQSGFPHLEASMIGQAFKLNIPVTVHPAIGTDFIHFHPQFSGEVVGALAERDFLLFSSIVSQLSDGGIYLNIGSSVILPEVFLKAVAFCTAQGLTLKNFTTAVFDFQRHYRPLENVCRRPVSDGGRGYYFVSPHEIIIPLLVALILNSE